MTGDAGQVRWTEGVAGFEAELRRLKLEDAGIFMRVTLAGRGWLLEEVVPARRAELIELLDDEAATADGMGRWTPVTT